MEGSNLYYELEQWNQRCEQFLIDNKQLTIGEKQFAVVVDNFMQEQQNAVNILTRQITVWKSALAKTESLQSSIEALDDMCSDAVKESSNIAEPFNFFRDKVLFGVEDHILRMSRRMDSLSPLVEIKESLDMKYEELDKQLLVENRKIADTDEQTKLLRDKCRSDMMSQSDLTRALEALPDFKDELEDTVLRLEKARNRCTAALGELQLTRGGIKECELQISEKRKIVQISQGQLAQRISAFNISPLCLRDRIAPSPVFAKIDIYTFPEFADAFLKVLGVVEDSYNSWPTKINTVSNSLKSLQERESQQNSILGDLMLKQSDIMAEKSRVEEMYNTLQKEVKCVLEENMELVGTIEGLKKEVVGMKVKCEVLSDECEGKRSALEETNRRIGEERMNLVEYEKVLQECMEQDGETKDTLDNLSVVMSRYKVLCKAFDDHTQSVGMLKDNIVEKQHLIEEKSRVADENTNVSDRMAELTQVIANFKCKTAEIADFKHHLTSLETSIADFEETSTKEIGKLHADHLSTMKVIQGDIESSIMAMKETKDKETKVRQGKERKHVEGCYTADHIEGNDKCKGKTLRKSKSLIRDSKKQTKAHHERTEFILRGRKLMKQNSISPNTKARRSSAVHPVHLDISTSKSSPKTSTDGLFSECVIMNSESAQVSTEIKGDTFPFFDVGEARRTLADLPPQRTSIRRIGSGRTPTKGVSPGKYLRANSGPRNLLGGVSPGAAGGPGGIRAPKGNSVGVSIGEAINDSDDLFD